MKKTLLLLLLPSLLEISCKSETDTGKFETRQEEKVIEQELRVGGLKGTGDADAVIYSGLRFNPNERKIIKTGEVSFESDDVDETRKCITRGVQKSGAYISSDNQSGYEGDQKEYSLVIKVPAANFDSLLKAVASGAGRIISKNIRVEDISSEYTDQETRIKNKRQLEVRYTQLLSKATQIGDMLKIENKLSELRSDIESATRKFLLLQQQVAYSTLTVTYYSKAPNTERHISFFSLFTTSFGKGSDLLLSLFFGLISNWPLFLLAILGCYYIYYRKKNRNAGKKAGS